MDIDFFSKWTKPMAWVLGWLYADGYLIKNGSFHIELKDEEIVKKIKELIKTDNNILKRKIRRGYSYRLSIQNKKMFNDLTNLGLTPKKSLTIKFPQIPNGFLQEFVRGYFEGDGCFLYRKNYYNSKYAGNLLTSFTCGSRGFLEVLRHELLKLRFKPQKVFKRINVSAFELRISGLDFPIWLYDNCAELYLKRKYNKLISIKEKLTNKIDKKMFYKGRHFGLNTEFKKNHVPWNKQLGGGAS